MNKTLAQIKSPSPPKITAETMEKLIQGDLSRLTPAERVDYYRAICESMTTLAS
jgi:hypothetical protein